MERIATAKPAFSKRCKNPNSHLRPQWRMRCLSSHHTSMHTLFPSPNPFASDCRSTIPFPIAPRVQSGNPRSGQRRRQARVAWREATQNESLHKRVEACAIRRTRRLGRRGVWRTAWCTIKACRAAAADSRMWNTCLGLAGQRRRRVRPDEC